MSERSPLTSYFAGEGGFDAAISEYGLDLEREVALCMIAEGFPYEVRPASANTVRQRQSELTAAEWTTEYGYGISTSIDGFLTSSDPNRDYLASISGRERESYLEALTGGFDGQPGPSVPTADLGCRGAAVLATGSEGAFSALQTFGSEYSEREDELFQRLELVDAVGEWSRCMADLGYAGFADFDAPEASIRARIGDVIAPLQSAVTDAQIRDLVSADEMNLAELPELEGLVGLQQDEIDLATADLACYEAKAAEVHEPLVVALEEDLLSVYSADFEAITDSSSN